MRASSSRATSEPGSSESDTLIPSSPPLHDDVYVEKNTEIDEPDKPVKFKDFLYSVKINKALLAIGLPACIAFEVLHLLYWRKTDWQPAGKPEKIANVGVLVTDAIGVGLTVSTAWELH